MARLLSINTGVVTSAMTYLHNDRLGSASAATGAGGVVQSQKEFDP